MDAIEALARELPADAAWIRRLFWRDSVFRTLCQDYRDAVEAAARHDQSQRAWAEEYRELAAELLAEAAARLAAMDRRG